MTLYNAIHDPLKGFLVKHGYYTPPPRGQPQPLGTAFGIA